MPKSYLIWIYFVFNLLSAQEKRIETIYFNFDKYDINRKQAITILDFIKENDTSKIESIQIYGYCDDRGNNDYNYKLSIKRVETVQNILTTNGFNKNKIIIIKGKGRVLIKKDTIEDISKTRSQNRRVDLLIIPKNSFGRGIYSSLQDKHKVGDRIYFETILFELGSSKLTKNSIRELDKIILLLHKNKHLEFEIRGHVCCTPNSFKDAIDRETNERKLSVNRAKAVFKYLIAKRINSLRMSYKGCGNKFPLGQGAEMDRRVEFLITKI
ncbi:OmpA family protein [Flavobacterium sp. 7A]|uniref:OmpA family protein n=1 Tax=Flavobacterium sp. 7A TaxID=2940571 RepID=UPI002227A0B1|nr:OmpA family protein [Flavobacterium sp. 7A]MCW2117934.1 outer membrane protein OmpA-like peptidoglycan-associated protein [Flavobacterium sp. 7A]